MKNFTNTVTKIVMEVFYLEVTIDLDYTPRSPRIGMQYTESSFMRTSSRFMFQTEEIGPCWICGTLDGKTALSSIPSAGN